MHKYIRKLQSKPESVRKQILFGSLAVFMSFVFFVWVSTLGHKFIKENTAKNSEGVKPFALFGQTLSDTYKNISASVGSISTLTKNKEVKEIKTEEKQIDLIPVEYQ